MKRTLLLVISLATVLAVSPALALDSGLTGVSQKFLSDCESADSVVSQLKSVDPLLALLEKYTNEAEQAHLELYIGRAYNQRTGVVDPAKAVVHFTAALRYGQPEKAYIQILMWRGNSQEQLKKTGEALRDYLRGLLACSYYDLSGAWPEIRPPKAPISINSSDPENSERARDYNTYRKSLDFQQFLLMQRYYFIEAVKRVTNERSEITETLGRLSPDSTRIAVVLEWLKSANNRPWP